jgi:ribosomal protein L17
MGFQPGNQESKKADHRRARVITQQLISALNEAAVDGSTTKLRKLVDRLIAKAIDGDVHAIKEIIDRVDGTVPQAIVGDEEESPITHLVVSRKSYSDA